MTRAAAPDDGGAVRAHITALRSAGFSLAAISRAAGVSDVSVWRIETQRTRRIRRPVADRLLGVCLDAVPAGAPTLDLAAPDVAASWSQRNPDSPRDVAPWSASRRWWRCPSGHEWSAAIRDRTRGRGCPSCYRQRRVTPV